MELKTLFENTAGEMLKLIADMTGAEGINNLRITDEIMKMTDKIATVWPGDPAQIADAKARINKGLSERAESLTAYKLYSPVNCAMAYSDGDYDGDYWRDDLSQDEAAAYTDEINAQIAKENALFETPRGLMEYYSERDGGGELYNKVFSLIPARVEEREGGLWLVGELKVLAPLTNEELAELKEYYTGQLSDGWGEGFEQREIKIRGEGGLYVEPWNSRDFAVLTERELFGAPELTPREELDLKLDDELKSYHNKLLTYTKERIIGESSIAASVSEAHLLLTEGCELDDDRLQALLETDNVLEHVAETLRVNIDEMLYDIDVDSVLSNSRVYVPLDESDIVFSGTNPENEYEVSVMKTIAKSREREASRSQSPGTIPVRQRSGDEER